MKNKQTNIQAGKTPSGYNKVDQERIIKASQSANLLDQDLRELVKSENVLLADVALEILHQAAKIEQRLKRLESICRS
jgi:hypothetical protein